MLKIGEFSKLSHMTVKALRFYEKEKLLTPASIDEWTGYRLYETSQLETAAKIKAFRQLDLSIEEIKSIFAGEDTRAILSEKANALAAQKKEIDVRLSIINHILEDEKMNYQVTKKVIPETIVYYSETVLDKYSDAMEWIPTQGAECMQLNPTLKCQDPPYEFCEYLDGEHKDADIQIRHNEAVTAFGNESDNIKFRKLPSTTVLSIFHKGAYDAIGQAYAYIMKYAEENGYEVAGLARECYIDGIWNKESEDEWLTEIQLPVKE